MLLARSVWRPLLARFPSLGLTAAAVEEEEELAVVEEMVLEDTQMKSMRCACRHGGDRRSFGAVRAAHAIGTATTRGGREEGRRWVTYMGVTTTISGTILLGVSENLKRGGLLNSVLGGGIWDEWTIFWGVGYIDQ